MTLRADLRLVILVSLDPAVDVQIHHCKIPVAFLLPVYFHLLRTVLMVEQIHALADEFDRRFEQVSIQGDGSVLAHPSPGNHAKVIF